MLTRKDASRGWGSERRSRMELSVVRLRQWGRRGVLNMELHGAWSACGRRRGPSRFAAPVVAGDARKELVRQVCEVTLRLLVCLRRVARFAGKEEVEELLEFCAPPACPPFRHERPQNHQLVPRLGKIARPAARGCVPASLPLAVWPLARAASCGAMPLFATLLISEPRSMHRRATAVWPARQAM